MEGNIQLTVVRYEVYPADEPTAWCVGFSIRHTRTGKLAYRDCLLPFDQIAQSSAEDVVLDTAWHAVRTSTEQWYNSVKDTPVVIGSVFSPVVEDPPPADPPVEDPPPADPPVDDPPPADPPVVEDPPPV